MPRESKTQRATRTRTLLGLLKKNYPDAQTELAYGNPFEMLVATILSAQATDKSVNAATPALFAAYPDAASMASATPQQLEPFVRTIGLYRNKAKNLVKTAQILSERFDGLVPNDPEALQTLPGVGQKTATVVLSNAYGRPGIAVDTHVGRLARRLGLSTHTDPNKVQHELEGLFPQSDWIFTHHALILHGRRVCHARGPLCDSCKLQKHCPKRGVDWPPASLGKKAS